MPQITLTENEISVTADSMRQAKKLLREALAALRVSEAAYRFGERGFLDVLDAQRVLRSVRADIIDARYQLQISRVALDQLMGHEAVLSPS